jgi:hypothetical protein
VCLTNVAHHGRVSFTGVGVIGGAVRVASVPKLKRSMRWQVQALQ